MSRPRTHRPISLALAIGALAIAVGAAISASSAAQVEAARVDVKADAALVLVVMDPLAKPLSCPCVEGYAQRDYDKLAAALEKSLGRKITVVYNDSLKAALKRKESGGAADIVIGKQSVVVADALALELSLSKIAMLGGKDGATTQTGLVVVTKDDPAQKLADLAGYAMYFGPAESNEKHAAAKALLERSGVAIPDKVEIATACDEGALKILELAKEGKRGFAVISSYAKPLLEGCGTIDKGAIRVVGETEPMPFIAAFVSEKLDAKTREAATKALLESTGDLTLRVALESKNGFVVEAQAAGPATPVQAAPKKTDARDAAPPAAKKK